jgi:hypothetical protein
VVGDVRRGGVGWEEDDGVAPLTYSVTGPDGFDI